MRAALAALVLCAAVPARAEDLSVTFAIPAARDGDVCLAIGGACGKLDEDGLLPLRLASPRGTRVLFDGRVTGDLARIDLLDLFRQRAVGALLDAAERATALELRFELEGPSSSREVKVLIHPTQRVFVRLRSRLLRSAGTPLPWAASFETSPLKKHPVLAFKVWRGRGGMDDLGRNLNSFVFPPGSNVGEIELLAIVDIQPVSLGRCPRCSVGDFGWPEVEFRCQRLRLDSAVSVYSARTGALVARDRIEGTEPQTCAENMTHEEARGKVTGAVLGWLVDVSEGTATQGVLVPARP